MSDFLATLAAQALSLAPVAHPLVPARYAPMPPIGGMGTLDGLRAGEAMAAPPSEGPPPTLDRLEVPPPLMEPGAYDTAYYPFSFLQLQQPSALQTMTVEPSIELLAPATGGEAATDVNPTETAPGADRLTILASSAPAGDPADPTTDSTGPLLSISEQSAASSQPVQQPTAAAAPSSSTHGRPTQDANLNREIPAATLLRATATSSLETLRLPGSDPQVAMPLTASTSSPAGRVQQAAGSHQEPVSRHAVVAPPSSAVRLPQMDVTSSPARGDGSRHGPSAPPAEVVPLATAEHPAAAERSAPAVSTLPDAAVVLATAEQQALLADIKPPPAERSAPAPNLAASSRPQGAASAFLVKPTSDAGTLPHPASGSGPKAPAGSGDQPQSLQTRPATGAVPLASRPAVFAPPPAVSSSRMDMAGSLLPGDARSHLPLTAPDSVITPATAAQPAPDLVASPRFEGAALAFLATKPTPDADTSPRPALDSRTQASASMSNQPQALQTPPATDAMPLAPRPEVVAPPPGARSPQSTTSGSLANGNIAAHVPLTPPAAATATVAVIQQSPVAEHPALPVAAANAPGPVPGAASQPPVALRAPESIVPAPAQTAAAWQEVMAGQTAPAASVKLPATGRNAPPPVLRSPAASAWTSTEESSTAGQATTVPVTAAPTTLATPGPRIELLPRPAPDTAAQAPTGPGVHLAPLQAPQAGRVAPLTQRPMVVAPSSGTSSSETDEVGSPAHTELALRIAATIPVTAVAPATIQRSPLASDHGLPAGAAKSLSSVFGAAGQPSALLRHPESMAPLAAWDQDQTASQRPEQSLAQPAPAASAVPPAARRNTLAAAPLPRQELPATRAASTALRTRRSEPAGEPAVVRPIIPVGDDLPAGQGGAGRTVPPSEPAPLPTIRVTIGRVEVRSSAPALPPAANPPSRPRPALSLDDYLKQPRKVRP